MTCCRNLSLTGVGLLLLFACNTPQLNQPTVFPQDNESSDNAIPEDTALLDAYTRTPTDVEATASLDQMFVRTSDISFEMNAMQNDESLDMSMRSSSDAESDTNHPHASEQFDSTILNVHNDAACLDRCSCEINQEPNCVRDCAGMLGGDATRDNCGICDNDPANDNTTCTQDCAGTWGGRATQDACGVCDLDPTNDNTTCAQDCAGTWGGNAAEDACGVCDLDPTNDNVTCVQDCSGTWNGSATMDNCGVCDTNPMNDNTTCAQDCSGTWNGSATMDNCGVCDTNPMNDNTTCAQDCAGTWNGSATMDNCGVCDTNPMNDNTTCAQDCAGTWNGTATMDDCGVCDSIPANDNATCDLPPLLLYLHPDGDDQNSGETTDDPLRSLVAANRRLNELQPDRDIIIEIALGTYYGQRVEWTFFRTDHTIEFTRPSATSGRPVFDGCSADGECLGGTWFQFRKSSGTHTNLIFNYLKIQNYQTALSFNGNRNDASASNGGNRIYGCYFDRIGNLSNPELNPSTAAIRFVNSDNNVVANSHFVDIINTRSAGLLHALYLAHMSDGNRIERNRFLRNSGDPIRLRDYSNSNIIRENRLIESGIAAGYTDWYCDHDVRTDCTKPEPECPSWNNEFRDNELDGDYQCDALSTFHYFQDEVTSGCSAPSADARRLRTSNNTRLDPPCQNN